MGKTCKWQKKVERETLTCKNPADESGFCILHDPSEDKDFNNPREYLDKLEGLEKALDFTGAIFYGGTGGLFSGKFGKLAKFDYAEFNEPSVFTASKFRAGVSFRGAVFKEKVILQKEGWSNDADFSGATFQQSVEVEGFAFASTVSFDGTIFEGPVVFKGGCSLKDANFSGAVFKRGAEFIGDIFGPTVNFTQTVFEDKAIFGERTTGEMASPKTEECEFDAVDFSGARFGAGIEFQGVVFASGPIFSGAVFDHDTTSDFSRATISNSTLTFNETKFIGKVKLAGMQTGGHPTHFHKCDLRGLIFVDCDHFPKRMFFEDCVWPLKKYFGFIKGRLA
ncbi:MAG: hypothetical protein V3T31_13280, partial [candidate division Zixibacteria bacterium]